MLARAHLAGTMAWKSDLESVQSEFEAILQAQSELFGTRHPTVMETQAHLAVTLYRYGFNIGHRNRAIRLMEEVASAWSSVRGAEHQYTKQAMQTLQEWETETAETWQRNRGADRARWRKDMAHNLGRELIKKGFRTGGSGTATPQNPSHPI